MEYLETIGSHPNIVGLKGFYEHESDQVVEVLDWAEEGTLRMVMDKGTLTLDQKFNIIKGISQGLQVSHEKGIIHRDVKPENILMAESGPQLMNFDRAYMSEGDYQTVWTLQYTTKDRRYLPPELALPMDAYDPHDASDLYSLGAIFYELLCGEVPFESPESFSEHGGVLSGEKLASNGAAGTPEWVDEIIGKLYVHEVKDRYADVASFLKDFYKKLESSPIDSSSKSSSEPKDNGSVLPSDLLKKNPHRINTTIGWSILIE